MAITLQDVKEAQARISETIIRTPIIRAKGLDEVLGCQVYLKHEGLQYTGSFKLRGASNRLLAMTEEEAARGVVCASSGNHAQGVACAAKMLGIDATIIMPTNANPVKLEGVKSFGARVLLVGTLSSEREAKMAELVETEGRTIVPPYDDDYVRAGQGTIALEVLEDAPELDAMVVPVGGGGLISGISTAAKALKPSIRIIGAEPAGAARYGKSRAAGEPIWLDGVDTIADGTRTDHANPNNYDIIERLVDDITNATDPFILSAMQTVVSKAKIVAEPSSVLGIAAVLEGNLQFQPTDKVCFVLSGGNIDPALLTEALAM